MRLGAAAFVFGVAALAACGEPRSLASAGAGAGACATCHGAPGEALPFRSSRNTPGAHDPHLAGELGRVVSCAECHAVPGTPEDPGHVQDSEQDVVFGALARTGGASPSFDGIGCTASYCHGNFPGGNASNVPVWQAVRTASCGTCHGVPPTTGAHEPHAREGLLCQNCHGTLLRAFHVNGVKDVPLTGWNAATRTCTACHHEGSRWEGD